MTLEHTRDLDTRLLDVAREVRVLSSLSWPEGTVRKFLISWRRGQPTLPEVTPTPRDLGPIRAELEAIVAAADPADPMQVFVARTADSYATAARMLGAVGTPEMTECSRLLYGAPDDLMPGSELSHRRAAELLLQNTENLVAAGVIPESERTCPAEEAAARMRDAFDSFFGPDAPSVEIDPDLASKAAAGSRRVRIRGTTTFSELDVAQLIEHEGFVHTATALNGRAQPNLACMALSAPRTTATQEGIATLAELTTRAIDIARLRRLALRTVAIHMALEGADYLEVFRFFLEEGQSEAESARSAMRVFRGGDVRGRVVFTKDVVYLCGLIAVHTFLRKAIAESRPHLVRRLFAGRLALPDVFLLDGAFARGDVAEPRYVPHWATDLHRLAAYLAFSAIVNRVDLGTVELERLLAE
ncbi:MAG: flavohemoglobin expression-modulating QEGLA motif protein [Myxococcota bacterium]|nr:flavohemoglobin expression-modulating QEGLA motif protein [Myxococcota bacterium]